MALLRATLVALALLALPAATAQAATVRITDPTGDAPPTFNAATDLVAASVTWEGGTLTLTATFAQRPNTLTVDAVVSEAARDESDPSVQECDQRAADVLQVVGTNDGGSLGIKGVRGRIEVPSSWDGNTITYAFRDPVIDRELAQRDPFTCASGNTGEDTYYGVFDGKVAKLTPATAAAAVRARIGGATKANCPRRTLTVEGRTTDDDRKFTPTAFCAYTRDDGARYRMGYASVHLDAGVARVTDVTGRSFPRSLQFCGITDFSGAGWRQPPVFGASMSAWAQRTSCRTARRVARRWRGRSRVMGFSCRRTRVGLEFVAVRCVRGRAVVRFESGS